MATPAEELDVDGVKVRFTNPDKVYFPKLGKGGTKRKLVEYYLTVASGPMLTALRDRPTHLQRFPDGIDGEEIYQKRVPQKHPDYLETCVVTFPSGRTADALKVTHPSAIVWAAQMGTITLHPWQVRCADTEHPDELRIDLDPQPGTGVQGGQRDRRRRAQAAARRTGVGRLPEDVRRPGCARVSCASRPTGISSRCGGRASRSPVRSSDVHPTPSPRRGGRRSAVSGCSSTTTRTRATAPSRRRTRRARPPIATVSTPVTWDELRDADPDDYTIATVPDLRGQARRSVADIDSVAQSIEPLLEMVRADETNGASGDLPYPPSYPKMPGEPPRVQPSKKVAANWDDEGNPVTGA